MVKKQVPSRRKRRTREHLLADLSVNHVERHALRCRFAVERVIHDYGIDLILFTYDEDGECEPGNVFLQLKATDRLKLVSGGLHVANTMSEEAIRRFADFRERICRQAREVVRHEE